MGALFTHKKKEALQPEYESLFEIPAKDIHGNDVLIGEVVDGCKWVLIVNVASKCMLANKHYTQMVKIHQE